MRDRHTDAALRPDARVRSTVSAELLGVGGRSRAQAAHSPLGLGDHRMVTGRLLLVSAVAATGASGVVVLSALFRTQSVLATGPEAAALQAAMYDTEIETALSLLAALLLGVAVPLALLAVRRAGPRLLVGLALFVVAPVVGSWPVYAYAYRGVPPGMHVNVPTHYRVAPLLAVAGAIVVTAVFAAASDRSTRRRSGGGEEA